MAVLSPERAGWLRRLEEAVSRRRLTRGKRLLRHPFSTIANSAASRGAGLLLAIGHPFEKDVETYFDARMRTILPTGYSEVWLYGATVDSDAEVRLNKYLLRNLSEGATFLDVGACLGYYSLLAAALVGERGEVHSFEPSPPLLPLLRRNVAPHRRIRLVEKALSDRAGRESYYVAPLPFIGTSSLRSDWQTRPTERVEVETTRLDEYCASAGVRPRMIKLDVEGAEDRVLRGAERTLRDAGPELLVEVVLPLIESDRRALELLRGLGYRPFAIQEDGSASPLAYADLDAYVERLRARYRAVQDSINDFENLLFRRA